MVYELDMVIIRVVDLSIPRHRHNYCKSYGSFHISKYTEMYRINEIDTITVTVMDLSILEIHRNV